MKMRIVLASQSPRRKQLLAYIVDDFDIAAADIDETPYKNELPIDYVTRLAKSKAVKVQELGNIDDIVIGSDTAVVCDNEILGKPVDLNDSLQILQKLSGRTHQVMTSFCIIKNQQVVTEVVTTDVLFKTLTDDEIIRYWQTQEPVDKAGSYAIQGIGGKFVTRISGSVSAVIGLPLVELEHALQEILDQ
ncbi:Maf family protein [Psychrosphaera sp. 1_MG-2023]|uniref:Maf family protein n=1 Tax=Psychrosphaera sp. 1_MG-2023 TaxID=3062643 RepID=UPI0026E440A1|nr:Maf family protein [Psychrosphaera sp. 1_MG-2023]MDO6718125.1 Maf family protein [Psychrosphaera sp. 1_MG-2023]